MKENIPVHQIEEYIFVIRGCKVMLDRHLAELYGVETKVLNRAVKRNIERFPPDFMFQLTDREWENLKCQIGTSSWGGDRRAPPQVFTEYGVSMLSSVLHSRRAIQMNIAIMRAFGKIRRMLSIHREFGRRLEELEKKYSRQDERIAAIFSAIRDLMGNPQEPRRQIGFRK